MDTTKLEASLQNDALIDPGLERRLEDCTQDSEVAIDVLNAYLTEVPDAAMPKRSRTTPVKRSSGSPGRLRYCVRHVSHLSGSTSGLVA